MKYGVHTDIDIRNLPRLSLKHRNISSLSSKALLCTWASLLSNQFWLEGALMDQSNTYNILKVPPHTLHSGVDRKTVKTFIFSV